MFYFIALMIILHEIRKVSFFTKQGDSFYTYGELIIGWSCEDVKIPTILVKLFYEDEHYVISLS